MQSEEGKQQTVVAGKASLKTTGKMGDVMKESSEIALTYAKKYLEQLSPGNLFFNDAALHMHIPEGATPKDGPSAGVTMVTSMLSLALNVRVPDDLAMTGELTLTGKVLPIGGVKEKVIAAKRGKVRRVLLPWDNQRDWTELDDAIKEGVTPQFCKEYADVWRAVVEPAPVSSSSDSTTTAAINTAAPAGSSSPLPATTPGAEKKEKRKRSPRAPKVQPEAADAAVAEHT
jgi:Lon-like ATP-dependent protease